MAIVPGGSQPQRRSQHGQADQIEADQVATGDNQLEAVHANLNPANPLQGIYLMAKEAGTTKRPDFGVYPDLSITSTAEPLPAPEWAADEVLPSPEWGNTLPPVEAASWAPWMRKLAAWLRVWNEVREGVLKHGQAQPPPWEELWWWPHANGKDLDLYLVRCPAPPKPGTSYVLIAPDGLSQRISVPSSAYAPWGATPRDAETLWWCAITEGRYFRVQAQPQKAPRRKKGDLKEWED